MVKNERNAKQRIDGIGGDEDANLVILYGAIEEADRYSNDGSNCLIDERYSLGGGGRDGRSFSKG